MTDGHEHCLSCYDRSCSVSQDCPLVSCSNDCGAKYHACKDDEHKLICTREVVDCINAQYGCPFKFERRAQAGHLHHCPANVVCCSHVWFRRRFNNALSSDPALATKHIDFALAQRDQRQAGGIEKLRLSTEGHRPVFTTANGAGPGRVLQPRDGTPEKLKNPVFSPFNIQRASRSNSLTMKSRPGGGQRDRTSTLSVATPFSKSSTDVSRLYAATIEAKTSTASSRASRLVRRCSFSVSPAKKDKDKRSSLDPSYKLFRWKTSTKMVPDNVLEEAAEIIRQEKEIEINYSNTLSVSMPPKPELSISLPTSSSSSESNTPQRSRRVSEDNSSNRPAEKTVNPVNGYTKLRRRLTNMVSTAITGNKRKPDESGVPEQAPKHQRTKSFVARRNILPPARENFEVIVQLGHGIPAEHKESPSPRKSLSCSESSRSRSCIEWRQSICSSHLRERWTLARDFSQPSTMQERRKELLQKESKSVSRLALELPLLFAPYHALGSADADLVQFQCSKVFRRDEIACHREFVHAGVDSLLAAGNLQERCPMAAYGCNFVRPSLYALQSGEELKVVHDSVCIQPPTNISAMIVDERVALSVHITTLPIDVLLHICDFLDPLALSCLAETCSHFRHLVASVVQERGMICQTWKHVTCEDGSVTWEESRKVCHFDIFSPEIHSRIALLHGLAYGVNGCAFDLCALAMFFSGC